MKKTSFKNLRDIQAIKAPTELDKQISYRDEKQQGLFLRVTSKDVRTWVYRRKIGGKSERIKLGYWPETTLEEARRKARKKCDAFDDGKNPAEIRREEEETDPRSVKMVGDEWLERHIDVNVDWPEARRIMLKDVIPVWKTKLVSEVTRADILRLIDSIVDRGSRVGANRIFAVARAWLNWCVQRGYISVSPATGLKPPTIEKSRDRVLNDGELAEILHAANSVAYPTGPFFVMLAMLAQRRGETASMKWSDIDQEKKLWTIQAEDTKAGRVHDVPLPKQAMVLLESFTRHKKGDYVFTTTDGEKSANGFSKAKVAIDKAIAERRRKAGIKEDIAHFTPHDLRRSAATGMAGRNVPPHVLSALLNHVPGSTMGVTSIYVRHRYSEERRVALQAWADHLDVLMKTATETKTKVS